MDDQILAIVSAHPLSVLLGIATIAAARQRSLIPFWLAIFALIAWRMGA